MAATRLVMMPMVLETVSEICFMSTMRKSMSAACAK